MKYIIDPNQFVLFACGCACGDDSDFCVDGLDPDDWGNCGPFSVY